MLIKVSYIVKIYLYFMNPKQCWWKPAHPKYNCLPRPTVLFLATSSLLKQGCHADKKQGRSTIICRPENWHWSCEHTFSKKFRGNNGRRRALTKKHQRAAISSSPNLTLVSCPSLPPCCPACFLPQALLLLWALHCIICTLLHSPTSINAPQHTSS